MLRLAKKMIHKYCSNVSSTSNSSWVDLSNASGNGQDDVRFTTRDNSGDGILLCAVTSTWLPFAHHRVFDYLRSEEYRAQVGMLRFNDVVLSGSLHYRCMNLMLSCFSPAQCACQWQCPRDEPYSKKLTPWKFCLPASCECKKPFLKNCLSSSYSLRL